MNILGVLITFGIIFIFFPYEHVYRRKVYTRSNSDGSILKNIEYENLIIKGIVDSSKKMVRLLHLNLSETKREKISTKIDVAGMRRLIAPDDFYCMKVGVAIYVFAFFIILTLINPIYTNIILTMIASLLGYYAPDNWLYMKGKNRQQVIQRQLPNMLSSLAVITDAGLNLLQAIQVYIDQNDNELSEELRKVIEDIRIGIDTKDAFINFSQRINIDEVSYFVSALVQGFEKGNAGFSIIIKEQAKECWDKRKYRAKEMAEKASLKLFLPMLLLVFPAFIIYLIGPMIFSFIKLFGGW